MTPAAAAPSFGRWRDVVAHRTGGCGEVLRGADPVTGAPVAIKVLRADLARHADVARRFRREAELLARLRHPALLEVLDVGDLPDGRPFVVTEWVDGDCLADELRRDGPLAPAEAARRALVLCDALAVVHAAEIVHRDLSWRNVMTARDGAVKLIDFGIARVPHLGPDSEATPGGVVIGTPAWMAPEQLRGQPADARTDLYGLGALLHAMLTGRPPYDHPRRIEVEAMHLSAEPPRPGDLVPGAAIFDRVVARCMAKRPQDRFGSAADVADAIRGVQRGAAEVATLQIHLLPADPDAVDDLIVATDSIVDWLERAGLAIVSAGGPTIVAELDGPAGSQTDPEAVTTALTRVLAERGVGVAVTCER